MEIFVFFDVTDRQAERLREIAGTDTLHLHRGGGGGSSAALATCEVALGNVPAEWLAEAPALRWMQLESVGFNDYAPLAGGPIADRIRLTNLAGFFSDPVAQSALAGVLALYRGIDRLVDLRREGDWLGEGLRPRLRTLAGANVVIFGRGTIARRFEALLAPFGCRVTLFGSDWTGADLDEALSIAEVVFCVAPGTDATRGVFDRDRLAVLPEGAVFANFGRGSLVDEDALADALAAGRLAGAVIDVTLQEPLPRDHRFWTSPNLILTQHTGGGSDDEVDRKIELFADNLDRYRRGAPLRGLVDLSRGY
jgi:phosphoglycerate dehydrogenase-like enzyme